MRMEVGKMVSGETSIADPGGKVMAGRKERRAAGASETVEFKESKTTRARNTTVRGMLLHWIRFAAVTIKESQF